MQRDAEVCVRVYSIVITITNYTMTIHYLYCYIVLLCATELGSQAPDTGGSSSFRVLRALIEYTAWWPPDLTVDLFFQKQARR